MSEGQPLQPDPIISSPETGSHEGIGNFITSLVEQQTNSQDEDEDARYNSTETRVFNLLIDLRMEASELWYPTVANVFEGYACLVYDQLPKSKQAIFLRDMRNHQKYREGVDLELTSEEGGILKDIAHAVGIEYDPGGMEDTEKRTFKLADIEAKAPDRSEVPPEYYYFFEEP